MLNQASYASRRPLNVYNWASRSNFLPSAALSSGQGCTGASLSTWRTRDRALRSGLERRGPRSFSGLPVSFGLLLAPPLHALLEIQVTASLVIGQEVLP